jgi:coproporphyrinogen III oxidase
MDRSLISAWFLILQQNIINAMQSLEQEYGKSDIFTMKKWHRKAVAVALWQCYTVLFLKKWA